MLGSLFNGVVGFLTTLIRLAIEVVLLIVGYKVLQKSESKKMKLSISLAGTLISVFVISIGSVIFDTLAVGAWLILALLPQVISIFKGEKLDKRIKKQLKRINTKWMIIIIGILVILGIFVPSPYKFILWVLALVLFFLLLKNKLSTSFKSGDKQEGGEFEEEEEEFEEEELPTEDSMADFEDSVNTSKLGRRNRTVSSTKDESFEDIYKKISQQVGQAEKEEIPQKTSRSKTKISKEPSRAPQEDVILEEDSFTDSCLDFEDVESEDDTKKDKGLRF